MMDAKILVTPQFLAGVLATALSLLFTYFPSLREWFAGKSAEFKSLFMIGGTALIAAVLFLASCQSWIVTDLVCTQEGLIGLVKIFFVALIANQTTFVVSSQPKDVKGINAAKGALG